MLLICMYLKFLKHQLYSAVFHECNISWFCYNINNCHSLEKYNNLSCYDSLNVLTTLTIIYSMHLCWHTRYTNCTSDVYVRFYDRLEYVVHVEIYISTSWSIIHNVSINKFIVPVPSPWRCLFKVKGVGKSVYNDSLDVCKDFLLHMLGISWLVMV